MFTQDHKADFDAILNATRPFALVRFGDGETAILDGRAHRSADNWRTKGPVWLRDELYDSLQTNMAGFCVGLPSPCCISRGVGLRGCVAVPRSAHTFATLFLHGNLPRAPELQKHFSDAVVVNDRYGDIRIPADGVTQPWDIDGVVTQLLEVDRPILLAAGPCSNLIAYRYWMRQDPKRRVSIIDIGSVLDVLHGDKTRHYHGTMDDHFCYWLEQSAPMPDPILQQGQRIGKNRVRIGRAEPSPNAQKIQHVRPRTRLGKR